MLNKWLKQNCYKLSQKFLKQNRNLNFCLVQWIYTVELFCFFSHFFESENFGPQTQDTGISIETLLLLPNGNTLRLTGKPLKFLYTFCVHGFRHFLSHKTVWISPTDILRHWKLAWVHLAVLFSCLFAFRWGSHLYFFRVL